jgi:hypothetical protein
VDWLRVIAIGLLIVYHAMLSFTWFAPFVAFVQVTPVLDGLGPAMGLLNVWRIPILFVISGMGVSFAARRRGWRHLMGERSLRLLVPLVFGTLALGPLTLWIAARHYGVPYHWGPTSAHLWFLGNIFVYALAFGWIATRVPRWAPEPGSSTRSPLATDHRAALLALPVAMVIEVLLVRPTEFAGYANTPHGWVLGAVCFLFGLQLARRPEVFFPSLGRLRWSTLALALGLYLVRMLEVGPVEAWWWPGLQAVESSAWIFAALGLAATYLNRPSRHLRYLNAAVYPVYIVHLPVQSTLAYGLARTDLPPAVGLPLLVLGVFAVSLLAYELLLRRSGILRPLFGLRIHTALPRWPNRRRAGPASRPPETHPGSDNTAGDADAREPLSTSRTSSPRR